MTARKFYRGVAGFSIAGYFWIAWNIRELTHHVVGPTVCLFKTVTHLPCPSCGTTRALVELLRGDFAGSLLINPLGILFATLLIVVPIWMIIDLLSRRESLFQVCLRCETLLREKIWIAVPSVLLVLSNWAWNILKGL